MTRTVWRLPNGEFTFSESKPDDDAVEVPIPEDSELHWTVETGWVVRKRPPKQRKLERCPDCKKNTWWELARDDFYECIECLRAEKA